MKALRCAAQRFTVEPNAALEHTWRGPSWQRSGSRPTTKDGRWKSRRKAADVPQCRRQQGGASCSWQKAAQRDGVEHVVKKMDGTIGAKNSYWNNPNAPKG
jgi:hypothetical protein